jgi:hypothetical protein
LKKLFVVNSLSPPEPPVFFIDRSLGRKVIPSALRQANELVKTHDEIFDQNTPDEVWLKEAGKQGWIVLTKDTRIRYHAHEVAALLDSGVRAFVLTARGDLTGAEMAAIFVKALPAIRRMAKETAPPFIARVQRDGTVEILRS